MLNTVICKATVHEGLSYSFHNMSLYAVIIQHLRSTLEVSYAKTVYAFADGIGDIPVSSVVGEVNSGL